MCWSKFSVLSSIALTVLLIASLPAHAQRGGGGGHGGGGGGGGHAGGGGHPGGGYNGGYHGGPGGAYYHGNGYRGYGYGGYGYGGYYGGGIGLGIALDLTPDYGYRSYYGTPDVYAAPVLVAPPAPTTLIAPNYGPAPTLADYTAAIRVTVPSDAVVWFDGAPTTQRGAERNFATPPLPADKPFHYEIKARWLQEGQPVERTMKIEVRPNQTTNADFTALPPPKG